MGDPDCADCPCSNISIMQLFHELKQRYPAIPDQVVSKIIQQNSHDKHACVSILEQESHNYMQSYPGALITGACPRPELSQAPLCARCPVEGARTCGRASSTPPNRCEGSPLSHATKAPSLHRPPANQEVVVKRPSSLNERLTKIPIGQLIKEAQSAHLQRAKQNAWGQATRAEESKTHHIKNKQAGEVKKSEETEESSKSEGNQVQRINAKEVMRETRNARNGGVKEERSVRLGEVREVRKNVRKEAQGRGTTDTSGENRREVKCTEERTSVAARGVDKCWTVSANGSKCDVAAGRPVSLDLPPMTPMDSHNYQVAVECMLRPWTPDSSPGDLPAAPSRSFTRVNLTLRPPSSEPQPPIEIQSGQGLTYTTASFDPRQGYQSQFQIRIGPVLLEKQRERRDMLSLELRRERVKLQAMQVEVQRMKLTLAHKPSPDILPKLHAEIVRLRAECKRLTQAVDQYSTESANILPLGETDEEFYRNIYTGQRLHRIDTDRDDASWSCHVCTFRNHELLTVCEECEMPRLMSLGSDAKALTLPLVRPRLPPHPRQADSRVTNVCANTNSTRIPGGGTSISASLTTAPLQEL